MASNDVIAMVTVLQDDDGPVAGVHGDRLIKLLANCRSTSVSFTQNGDGRLQLDADFAAKLLTHASEPPFVWPQPSEDLAPIEVDETVLAFARMAKAIVDPRSPSQQACGISVVQDDSGLYLYCTDGASLVRSAIEQPGEPKEVILSLPFVEQMLRLGGRGGDLMLESGYALFEAHETGLWGRYIVPEPDAADFEAVLRKRRPLTLMPLPDGFYDAVARAGVMAAREAMAVPVSLSVANGEMRLISHGPSGDIIDPLPFEHEPVTIRFDQKLVERLTRLGITRLGMTKKTMLFGSEDGSLEYMIAAH
jgi:hypothetical protein